MRYASLVLTAVVLLLAPDNHARAQGLGGVFTTPGTRYCLRQWPSGQVDCRFASLAQCRKAAKDKRDNCVVNNWETTGPNSINRN